MIIRKEGKRLLNAGTVRVVATDPYSVTIEGYGLAENGDPVTFTVVLSGNEIALINRAKPLI